MNAIELKQVNFSYDGKTKILENTDFTAEYGEVTFCFPGIRAKGKARLCILSAALFPM